jgi:hypothetical protein
MKKVELLIFGLITSIFLVSCGGDMDGWPYCDLPDSVANYDTVTIEKIEKDSNNEGKIISNEKYFSSSRETVLAFYNLIESMHVSPEKTNKTFDEYWQKVSINFEKDKLSYIFDYYELSITDGYFVFNFEEAYKFKGDFYSVVSNAINEHKDTLIKI